MDSFATAWEVEAFDTALDFANCNGEGKGDLPRTLAQLEGQRHGVLFGGESPTLATETTLEMVARFTVNQARANGDIDAMLTALAEARKLTTYRSATIGGTPVSNLRGADPVLESVLEVFTAEGYRWVPWAHVNAMAMVEPDGWFEHRYRPAVLLLWNGDVLHAVLPTRYAGTSRLQNDAHTLGQQTNFPKAETLTKEPWAYGLKEWLWESDGTPGYAGLSYVDAPQFDTMTFSSSVKARLNGVEGEVRAEQQIAPVGVMQTLLNPPPKSNLFDAK